MEHEVSLWLEFARTDLGVAEHLNAKYHPKPLEIICYHCQQSVEKALKALIVAFDVPGGVPKKHNLPFLLAQVKNYVKVPLRCIDGAEALSPYGVAIRYPSEFSVEECHAREALSFAREIVEWVEKVINSNEISEQN